jgi:hypothetical protein
MMGDGPARVWMAMWVAAYTGMRFGEAFSLRREQAGDFLTAVEVGVPPNGRNRPKAFGGADDPAHFECESCREMVVGDPLSRQGDVLAPRSLPPVPGLTCLYHDLDQTTALKAHLDEAVCGSLVDALVERSQGAGPKALPPNLCAAEQQDAGGGYWASRNVATCERKNLGLVK